MIIQGACQQKIVENDGPVGHSGSHRTLPRNKIGELATLSRESTESKVRCPEKFDKH